jgi:hypothetical protein
MMMTTRLCYFYRFCMVFSRKLNELTNQSVDNNLPPLEKEKSNGLSLKEAGVKVGRGGNHQPVQGFA